MLPLSGVDSGAWSPDSREIALRCRAKTDLVPTRNAPGTSLYRLCISKLDGTSVKRFPWPLMSVHPDWAPTR